MKIQFLFQLACMLCHLAAYIFLRLTNCYVGICSKISDVFFRNPDEIRPFHFPAHQALSDVEIADQLWSLMDR